MSTKPSTSPAHVPPPWPPLPPGPLADAAATPALATEWRFADLPPVVSAADLVADESVFAPPLIVDGMLHVGSKLVVGSTSKARKSWTLLHLCIAVATGGNWLGQMTNKGKVLLINFEIDGPFLKQRIQAICKSLGVPAPRNLDVWTLRGHCASLEDLLPEILRRVRGGGYTLVVLDPIYKCLGGRDENKAGDVASLCNLLEQIAVEGRVAVAIAAHFTKGNSSQKSSIDRISGSGVFTRDADSIVTLTPHAETNCYSVETTLRNVPELAAFVVEWQFPLMQVRSDLNPADLQQRNGAVNDMNLHRVLELIPSGGLKKSAWVTAIVKDKAASRSHAYKLIQKLADDGVVAKMEGDLWEVTTRGANFLHPKTT